MNIVLIVIGIIIFAVISFVVYRMITVRRQSSKLNALRFERVKVIYEKLERGLELTEQDVFPFAQNILTRQAVFQLLNERGKGSLFPKEYNSLVKAAESNLVNWLEFPTELGACPDKIEHLKRITFDFDGQNNHVHYEIFKYRVNEPHWAAKEGWILGVVGPYFDDSKPYDFPRATFSRVSNTVIKTTPEEEAKWVHENVSFRR